MQYGVTNPRACQALVRNNGAGGKAKRFAMHYRVYSGPKGSPDLSPLEKSQMLFKEFTDFDAALSWAHYLEGTGRIPLLIEGDDGTRMDRRAIIDALRVGMREQLGE
jgi:hypothetical protein